MKYYDTLQRDRKRSRFILTVNLSEKKLNSIAAHDRSRNVKYTGGTIIRCFPKFNDCK